MRYCELCLNKLVINMRMAGKSRPFTDFLPKKEYILDNTICDICGTKLTKEFMEQWNLANKMYSNVKDTTDTSK